MAVPQVAGIGIGERNVIAGDIIARKEEVKVAGDATFVTQEDDTKRVLTCAVCGRNVPYADGYTCPGCGRFVCTDHYYKNSRQCHLCAGQEESSREKEYSCLLEQAYADGKVDLTERKKLDAARERLGISAERAKALESRCAPKAAPTGSALTRIERHKLENATRLLMEEYRLEEAAMELADLWKLHPHDDEVLSLYLRVQKDRDPSSAKEIISSLNADIKEAYISEIDIAIREMRLSDAEKIIEKAKTIYADDVIVACKELELLIGLFAVTGDSSYVTSARLISKRLKNSKYMYEESEICFSNALLLSAQGERDAIGHMKKNCAKNNIPLYPFLRHEALLFDKDYSRVDSRLLENASKQNDISAQYHLGMRFLSENGDASETADGIHLLKNAAEHGHCIAQRELGLQLAYGDRKIIDQQKAFIWMQKAAGQGDVRARTELAIMYKNGIGTNRDIEMAIKYFVMAAEGGSEIAQRNLGIMYLTNDGLPLSEKKAMHYFQMASEKRDALAMLWIGRMYDQGTGFPKDTKLAILWYEKAAQEGQLDALNALGTIYENGIDCEKDYKTALEYYGAAAASGLAIAQYNLARMYFSGTGVPCDNKNAISWFKRAADQSLPEAMMMLATMYENGMGVEKEENIAFSYYERAAEQDNALAQCKLGEIYQEGELIGKDSKKAIELFRKAARQNLPPAIDWLGVMYENGYGVEINLSEALKNYKRAAEFGYSLAQYHVGQIYNQGGDSITKNYTEAEKWYSMAAKNEYAPAMYKLGELYYYNMVPNHCEKEIMFWITKAAEEGYSIAQGFLGWLYMLAIPSPLHADLPKLEAEKNRGEKAAFWLSKAIESGDAEAYYNLARLHIGMPYFWFNACEGLVCDVSYGIELLVKAAELGIDEAYVPLAEIYKKHMGNTREAKKWYKRAASLGNKEARRSLFWIKLLHPFR